MSALLASNALFCPSYCQKEKERITLHPTWHFSTSLVSFSTCTFQAHWLVLPFRYSHAGGGTHIVQQALRALICAVYSGLAPPDLSTFPLEALGNRHHYSDSSPLDAVGGSCYLVCFCSAQGLVKVTQALSSKLLQTHFCSWQQPPRLGIKPSQSSALHWKAPVYFFWVVVNILFKPPYSHTGLRASF